MNKKNLAALYIRLESNLEIARTSRDTGKTLLINYVIGDDNNKKENLREAARITRIRWKVTYPAIVTSKRHVSYKSIYKSERKRSFFENSLAS